MIYGDPGIRIENDVTDLIGIRTLILSRLWEPSRWPLSDGEMAGERPSPPAMGSNMLLIGEQTRRASGAVRTMWTFEGVHAGSKGVVFKDRDSSLDYGFEPGFAEVDMRLFPKIDELMKNFSGYPDPDYGILWDKTLKGDGKKPSALSGNGSTEKDRPNPMWGRESFLRMEGTYRFRYASLTPPSPVGVNRIFVTAELPGQPPPVENRDWLKLDPQYRRRGVIFDCVEMYWLSGPGFWPAPLYSEDMSSGNSSGGLSTGGLTTGSL